MQVVTIDRGYIVAGRTLAELAQLGTLAITARAYRMCGSRVIVLTLRQPTSLLGYRLMHALA